MKQKKLVVIGGGAAGFFCAVNAASFNTDLSVIIVEKTIKILSKVKVSGGGRCNVTHACSGIADMAKNYPRGASFLKKSFQQFFVSDTIEWFAKRNVTLHTEEDGRMFPVSNSSDTIINCLLQEANKYNVQVLLNHEVTGIKKDSLDTYFLDFKNAPTMHCDFVCIACGGFTKSEHFYWIEKLGHNYEMPVPSLFTFNVPNNVITKLMGISVEKIHVKINQSAISQSGPLLITQWGFSGPAILKLSSFAARELAEMNYDFLITVNWLSDYNENTLLEKLRQIRFELASKKIINKNPFNLPQRLWEYHLNVAGIKDDIRWANLPSKQQNIFAKQLCSQQFQVKGKTTFKEEFVTAGGILLQEIYATTMESKTNSNLFFAGEIMNVDGVTGGFNFQHAWTSGWIAAKRIGELLIN